MSNFILTYKVSNGIIKYKFFSNIGTQMLDSQGVVKPKYFPVPITGEQMLDYALKYLHPKDDKVLCVETWITRDIFDTDPTIKQALFQEYYNEFEK